MFNCILTSNLPNHPSKAVFDLIFFTLLFFNDCSFLTFSHFPNFSLPLMFSVIISMRCIISIKHHGELAGKTPDIPRDILLEVLGPSKVYKEVIKKVINSTVAEYVDKYCFLECNSFLHSNCCGAANCIIPLYSEGILSMNLMLGINTIVSLLQEGLKVSKDLRVEQSFEDLEDAFEPDEKFSFDAVIQLQQTT
ncbi:hypothetical protein POTOM_045727 [Populus tomentosa]|uniref:Uncharacterized protein n=1 Tax=Populus tomentosa TaxID=118781 RepID=A0A8X7YDP8_POPTO|nr:hypothetical protein POTOM_045727 [Populus tomentosa]